MESNSVPVEDKIVTTTQTVTRLEIELVNLVLGTSARFSVRQFNDRNIIDVSFVEMSGDDYKAWGSDDNYVENYILNTLGFVKKE